MKENSRLYNCATSAGSYDAYLSLELALAGNFQHELSLYI